MKLADTMNSILRSKGRQVWSVSPNTSVFDALAMMADHEIGALLVISDNRPVGIFSERDYARKVILQGKSSKLLQVQEVMASPVISVALHNTVDDCMNVMTDSRIRHLPVVDQDRVVGIVSIGDLVKWIITAQDETIHQLENYIAGKYPA
ncbi:MAG: CBS domain-containing protein [Acidobacteria bacterium]|nr:CBS domain-containing protein [Acidobacteriota bacterium]MCI0723797.1 CBS domain-containing protein [Acidobacteriota bacterium]